MRLPDSHERADVVVDDSANAGNADAAPGLPARKGRRAGRQFQNAFEDGAVEVEREGHAVEHGLHFREPRLGEFEVLAEPSKIVIIPVIFSKVIRWIGDNQVH